MTLRRRGLTLIELTVTISLLIGMFLLVGTILNVSLRWNETAIEVAAATHRTELLRSNLGRAARGAQPIAALSLLPDGRLTETMASDAAVAWSEGDTLLLRRPEGYTLFSTEGGRLVVRRISSRGHVTVSRLLGGVKASDFEVRRTESGRALGIDFHVEFRTGADVRGFVAMRTVPQQQDPFAAPPRAPRYGSGR